jgi:hypothetical protein
MKYERLTLRLQNGKIGCLQEYSQKDLINRLAELEDKIENGTLIEFPRIVPPIKYNNYSLWSVEYVNRAYGNISTDFYGTKEDVEERLKELQGE